MVGDGSYLMMNSELATSVMSRAEDHRGGARQPGLRLHHPPPDGNRRGTLQQPARRCTPRGVFRTSISWRMPERSARSRRRPAPSMSSSRRWPGAGVLTLVLHRDRHRSDGGARKRAATGGTSPSRGLRARGGARRARGLRGSDSPGSARATERDDSLRRQSHRVVPTTTTPRWVRISRSSSVCARRARSVSRGSEGPQDARRSAGAARGARATRSRARLGLVLAGAARARRGSREGPPWSRTCICCARWAARSASCARRRTRSTASGRTALGQTDPVRSAVAGLRPSAHRDRPPHRRRGADPGLPPSHGHCGADRGGARSPPRVDQRGF